MSDSLDNPSRPAGKQPTSPRPLFRSWLLASILGGLVAYVVLAELIGFDLVTLRGPDESVFNHRLRESMLLWTAACSAAGWVAALRRRGSGFHVRLWPLITPVILAALWLGATEACQLQEATQNWSVPLPTWVHLVGVAIPLALGGILGVLLYLQVRIWRRWGVVGVCLNCGYNLTGNVSGVCPECGEPVDKGEPQRGP
jgi:hypothetical protein